MSVHYSENNEKIIVDMSTGEIAEHIKVSTRRTIKREEEYFMIMFYTGNDIMMKGLPRSCDYIINMLSIDCHPWKDGDVRSMCVIVGDAIYQSWADRSEGEYKKNTIKARFMDMVKADIFRRVQRGLYMVNPYYLFKGNIKDVKKARERYDSLPKAGRKKNNET